MSGKHKSLFQFHFSFVVGYVRLDCGSLKLGPLSLISLAKYNLVPVLLLLYLSNTLCLPSLFWYHQAVLLIAACIHSFQKAPNAAHTPGSLGI